MYFGFDRYCVRNVDRTGSRSSRKNFSRKGLKMKSVRCKKLGKSLVRKRKVLVNTRNMSSKSPYGSR